MKNRHTAFYTQYGIYQPTVDEVCNKLKITDEQV